MRAPDATPMPAGTMRRAPPRLHLESHEHRHGQRHEHRHEHRPGTADTARARRIAGGIECVAAPRPSIPTRPAASVRQLPGEPPADRDRRSAVTAAPKARVGGVQPLPPATLPAALPELAACPAAGETHRPRVANPIRFRRRIGSARKWIGQSLRSLYFPGYLPRLLTS